MPVGAVVGDGGGAVPVGAGIDDGMVVGAADAVGLAVGDAVGAVDEVGIGVALGAGGVTLHPVAPAAGAPAFNHAVRVAISPAPSRAFGGGGIGFVSLAIRSAARLATVRWGLLRAALSKSAAVSSGIGTPKFRGGA